MDTQTFEEKQKRIRALLSEKKLEAVWLTRESSFAWATDGARSYINTASSNGAASLLVTQVGRYLITTNIEAPRLEQEEGLAGQDWTFRVEPWYEPNRAVAELTRGLAWGADSSQMGAMDLSDEVAHLRADLLPAECERFRQLARLCAEAMDNAIRRVRPGQTEHQVAALLAEEAESRGVQAIVNLIATDERISRFRHPLPTDKVMDRYAMLVLCGRKWGLVCSLTRLVHFGKLPDELAHKAHACAQVDATLIAETRPGRVLGNVFERAVAAYREHGFADEWHKHHQGGPAGYEPREYIATLSSKEQVRAGQVFAWNPSVTGCKSEDTILIGESGNEVLTTIAGWPALTVELGDGTRLERPAVLEIM